MKCDSCSRETDEAPTYGSRGERMVLCKGCAGPHERATGDPQ